MSDVMSHKIQKIVEIYDNGLASFREIGELEDIQLSMATVRRIYMKHKGQDQSVSIKKYDKMSELDQTYIDEWQKQEQERKELQSKQSYYLD